MRIAQAGLGRTVVTALLGLAIAAAAQAQAPPNIVLIIGDDHGWPYSGFMGDPHVVTPNLDALAAEGMVFRNTHMTGSTCVPSLRTLLAGIHSPQWDAVAAQVESSIDIPYRESADHIRTLPRELQRRGYLSWEGGKMWEGSFRQAGFTHGMATQIPPDCPLFCSEGEYFGRTGIDPLREFLDRAEGRPFFAWVAPMLPHTPFDAAAEYRAPYLGQGLSNAQITYYANVTWLDDVVGEVLAELDARGLRENTLVLYLSDNGWEIGGWPGVGHGKGTLYELGFRTPLIVNWAGHVPQGVVRDDLVAGEDVFSTLLAYAGAPALPDRDGINLKPAIESGAPTGRTAVVTYYDGVNDVGHIVRTANWRYISFETANGTILREELYAIASDPFETTDVAAQNGALLPGFRAQVAAWEAGLDAAPSALDVTGRVVDDGGEPVSGLRLRLSGGATAPEVTTDAGGWFKFVGVAHGNYQLSGVGVAVDWFGVGPDVPVAVPTGGVAPYLALGVSGYQNPIGVGTHGKDPTVLVADGAYHLFSSFTGDPQLAGNVPLQRSDDGLTWEYLGDALPDLPDWADPADAEVSAPAALSRPSLGRYLLYFSARHRNDGSGLSGRRCIGVVAGATPSMLLDGSASLIPAGAPLVCAADRDALDPAIFTAAAPSGDPYAWLLWVERRTGQPDVIVHTLLNPSGAGMVVVPPLPMLTAETGTNSWEQGRLANPAVVRDAASGTHFLFYSGNDPVYSVDNPTVTVVGGQPNPPQPARYGANWATCTASVFGVFLPCVREQRGPWLRSQNDAFRPGDADFFRDASGALWMVYDASSSYVAFFSRVFEAPRLRLDKVCIGSDGRPRTDGPTTVLTSSQRNPSCALDVALLAEDWPEADALFHQDPRWRGADGAWSIDLGDERSLWTFGDTYVNPQGGPRASANFIRNSIAIQQGADPTTADMTFHWKTTAGGAPTAYFKAPSSGNTFYWGGAGDLVGNKLVMLQEGWAPVPGGIQFVHSKGVVIANYEDDPSLWQQQWYDVAPDPQGNPWNPHYATTIGSYLYVYVTRAPASTGSGAPTAALLRYPNTQARNGNFSQPRWWTGSGWSTSGPVAVLWQNSAQYSVHDIGNGEHFAIMGASILGPGMFATAAERTGPFSVFMPYYAPPESSWGGPGVWSYHFHAHPQLSGAPIVTTYATHGHDIGTDESTYYPKFVRFSPP